MGDGGSAEGAADGAASASSSLRAENEPRSTQKPISTGALPTREDVESIALPMLRSLTLQQVDQLREHARSFDLFASQVFALQGLAELEAACWT